ncbi:MAG: aldehyde ferredoxin oxidoreductase family protein [Oscillospiraceae bacterium]|nr:aldehyde ferredoxin oxidoreductase family protein [Oscillospiraceae bacterium]
MKRRGKNTPPLPVYARVDLTTGGVERFPISEKYFKKYVGGKCLAARLLLDLTPPGLDPLSPEAVIIINTGPLNGTGAPSTSRFNLSFKNVLTGGIASSNCGGQFGVMLKRAGFDGLIITGRAAEPSLLEILDGEITLKPAPELWGLDAEKTQEALPEWYGKLVIGPAGENRVLYASSISGERVAGRCGSGAVLGSKNLKALVAYGTKRPEVYDREGFDKFVAKWIKFIKHHPMTGQSLPRYGSAGLVNKANATNALPTKNFQRGHFDRADAVSGETLTETQLIRNSGCVSCPIRCERRVPVDGRNLKGPEYETLGFFGPNIEAADMDTVLRMNWLCDIYGVDTISFASSLAFAMELKERGMADFGVEFGRTDNLEEVLVKVAHREGIYSDIADGTKRMAAKYGGEDFAINAKGLELASYEPRRSVGMGLGYAVANRGGCHLNGGYLALLESVGVLSMDALTPRGKAQFTAFMQDALEAVSSAGCCLFSAQTFVPGIFFDLGPNSPITRLVGKIMPWMGPMVALMLNMTPLVAFNSLFILPHAEALHRATGLRMFTGQFLDLGERSYNLERLFNLREGLTAKDDSLPKRLTKELQDPKNPRTAVPLEKMLPVYYKTRGWDKEGRPKRWKLLRLGIEEGRR